MEFTKSVEDSIFIGLTGDVMIGRLVEKHLSHTDVAYLWGDLLPFFQATDFNLINLEAALTNSDKAVFKVFNFKAKPERVAALKLASINVANLANNHSLDFSEEGLFETLDVLDRETISHVGAGRNIAEAKSPVIAEVNGVKIGIIGCTDNEPTWEAKVDKPGVFYLSIDDQGAKTLKREVGKIREQVDLVILTIHWGPNMRERPPESFVRFAHQMIESGVDIFHGHSAHIFQGVEVYQGKVIFYDTGDFVDDYYVDPYLRNDRSFFFVVEATKKGMVDIRLVPTFIDRFQVNVSQGHEREATIQRMQNLSQEFGTRFTVEDGMMRLRG